MRRRRRAREKQKGEDRQPISRELRAALLQSFRGQHGEKMVFASIYYFDFLNIDVSKPWVVFCVCPMLQFNVTIYLSQTPIVYIIKNIKTKYTHKQSITPI